MTTRNRYMILIHGDGEAFESLPMDQANQMLEQLLPFEETVAREGALLSTNRLVPASRGKLVSIKNGFRTITDGPFIETKEQFGGYYLVEAASIEQVIGWTELIPSIVDSTLEVRQVIDEERSIP